MAAIAAARAARDRCCCIERTADGGRKILISGGGRCNVLPSALAPERFVTDSPPHLMRGMLRSWPLGQQRAFFERDSACRSRSRTETGKLFPVSNRARDVRDGARRSRARARRRVRVRHRRSPRSNPPSDGWIVQTTRGRSTRVARGPRHRRPLGAGDRQRRHGPAARGRRSAIACNATVSGAHAADRRTRPCTQRSAACRSTCGFARESAGKRTQSRRRVSVHASRLQRPGGARHLARRGAQPQVRQRSRHAARAVGAARCGRVGSSSCSVAPGLVGNAAWRTHLPQRLAAAADGRGRRARRSTRRRAAPRRAHRARSSA